MTPVGAGFPRPHTSPTRAGRPRPYTTMIGFDANFDDMLRDLEKVIHVIEPAARAGIIAATGEALAASRDEMSELIYNEPETEVMRRSRSSGRVRKAALWKRKSNLLRNERAEFPRPGGPLEGRITNNMPYALPRHELEYPAKTPYFTLEGGSTPGGKGKGKAKKKTYKRVARMRPDRTAHWRLKARDRCEEAARAKFEAKFDQMLQGGGA